jgi:lipopolysaccharide cholinephosphotransferase
MIAEVHKDPAEVLRKHNDIQRVQTVCVELLDIIIGFCQSNNLTYWIDGGTLLGSVRHSGFIPWDDDLDVCLPYSDYTKLIALLKEFCQKSDRFMLYYGEKGVPNWSDYLSDTTVFMDAVLPVRIDLIPMKLIPDTTVAVEEHTSLTNLAMIWNLGKAKNPSFILSKHNHLLPVVSGDLNLGRHLFYQEYLSSFGSDISEIETYDNWLLDYSFGDAYVKNNRKPMPLLWIFPLGSVVFEGRTVNAPGQVEAYLTNLYGPNFMQPPKKEMQIPGLLSIEDSQLSKSEVMELLSLRREAVFYNLALDTANPEKARQFRRKISFLRLAVRLLLRGKFSMMAAITRHAWLYFRNGVK